jgi:hypothetical protein
LGQGRENARKLLAENTDVRDKIAVAVKEKIGLKKTKPESTQDIKKPNQ